MNFTEIINNQLKLDQAIKKAHSISENNDRKMLIALYTEIGELANEVQSFKYWKKTKTINENDLLEEYADGLHFLMSFAIKTNSNIIINPLILSNDINEQFLEMFNCIHKLTKRISKKNVEKAIGIYIGLAKLLNISDEKINEAYNLKNKKNFERIKNNY